MADANPTATNPSAASAAPRPVHRVLVDLETQMYELRGGLGVLRALACEDHLEVNGHQLAWVADRLLDGCEAAEGYIDQIREQSRTAPAPSPAEPGPKAAPPSKGEPRMPDDLNILDREVFGFAFHEEAEKAGPHGLVGDVVASAMARVRGYIAARDAARAGTGA